MVLKITLKDDNIVCHVHRLDLCSTCQINWTPHNLLASSLKQFNSQELPSRTSPYNTALTSQINRLKYEGNQAYKIKKYQQAIDFYSLAVKLSWSRPLWEPFAFQLVKQELVPILSNRSAAYDALERYGEAFVDADIVTKLKKDWSKGWFRKGKAQFGLKRWKDAKQAYRMALVYHDDEEDSCHKDVLVALKQIEEKIGY